MPSNMLHVVVNFLFLQAFITSVTFGLDFCFDGNHEGHRLNATVLRRSQAVSPAECILHCVNESCCRSVNYRKKGCGDSSGNCELIHAHVTENPQYLLDDEDFDHYVLSEPRRTFNCSCMLCNESIQNCSVANKRCDCLYGQDGMSCGEIRTSCAHWKSSDSGIQDGEYLINPEGHGTAHFRVWCDMSTDGGGWTVFQRRKDGSQNFNLSWNPYKNGFGEKDGDFWLGLDRIHRMVDNEEQVLRVDLEDWQNERRYALYQKFSVASAKYEYKLAIGGYSGDAGDSFNYHNGGNFSTYDKDNDLDDRNCAKVFEGGWWFRRCMDCNLNGHYMLQGKHSGLSGTGVHWDDFKGNYYSLKYAEMKIRPKN